MNADQLKWKWMQFKGDLKGKWGKFTYNDLREIAGDYDKFVGKVRSLRREEGRTHEVGKRMA